MMRITGRQGRAKNGAAVRTAASSGPGLAPSLCAHHGYMTSDPLCCCADPSPGSPALFLLAGLENTVQ